MRATAIFLILLAPLTTLALATPNPVPNDVLVARQTRKAPPPCKRAAPEPTEPETKARHDKFVNAFLVKKNITEAFEYIVEDYIVYPPFHSPQFTLPPLSSLPYILFLAAKAWTEPQPHGAEWLRLSMEYPKPHLGQPEYSSSSHYI